MSHSLASASGPEALAPPARPRTSDGSRHVLAGAASFLVSGLLGLTWLWVSVALLAAGLSAIPAAGSGVLLLVVWVLAMRVAASAERRRARAAHGLDVIVPSRRVSARTGFAGWAHTLWLDVSSWPFWRSVLHHHALMLTGLVLGVLFWSAVGAITTALDAAIRVPSAQIGVLAPGRLGWLGLALLALLLSAGLLALGVLAERALDRAMLPLGESALRAEVQELTARRQGAVDAAEAERLRIERDLHDGIQPRLVALGMTLGMARPRIATDPERAAQLVDEAHTETKEIITELRQLARGIHPAVLADRGLDAALSAIAARSPVPVELRVDLPHRPDREAEAVAYFVVSEALTNIARHAGATRARVDLHESIGPEGRPVLDLRVADDGRGGARIHRDGRSTGLAGLTDRVRATGGRLEIRSTPPGGADPTGTELHAVIPLRTSGSTSDPQKETR